MSRVATTLGKVGSGLSFACAIHCMAMPLLLTILPIIGMGFVCNGLFDLTLILLAVLLSSANLCWGFRKHNKMSPVLILSFGTMLFMLAQNSHYVLFRHHHLIVSIIAGLCFLIANKLNANLCRSCKKCEHSCEAK